MSNWHSLYIPADDPAPIAERLRTALQALGYTLYQPFGLMPTRPYKQSVRLFVAPARAGWVRIIGEPTAALVAELAADWPVLWLSLARDRAGIQAFARGGEPVEPVELSGAAAAQVDRARQDAPSATEAALPGLPLAVLPSDVQKLAANVDAQQAGRLFERLSGELMKRAGGDMQAARGLLDPKDAPDWASDGGARLFALAQSLGLPDSWRLPDFISLRDAYQAGERRRRKPDAPPFPGDDQALAAAPDALDHTPIFGGWDA
jgi:hypothetical protein